MPKGIPKKGFRRTNKLNSPSIEEVERRLALRYPEFLDRIEELAKPMCCPGCGMAISVPDREALIYLCDRVAGKPRNRTEVDITSTVQFNADQLDRVLRNKLPQIVEIYGPEIRGLLGPVETDKI